MSIAISVKNLTKNYDNNFTALKNINLEVKKGEIFALLGPNGAGKTTLINIICGITKYEKGTIDVFGFDNVTQYRQSRSLIGLVPQELTTDTFEKVWNTVNFSRGLFGKKKSHSIIRNILKKLSLIEKKDSQIRTLSGGMKRRVMIAKAMSHEPKILFLDEPSAGVDVELRKSMWLTISQLRKSGVTIILTTHYINEAEEIADRIGIINQGKLSLIENKNILLKKLGKKEMILNLSLPMQKIPNFLTKYDLNISNCKKKLIFRYDNKKKDSIFEILNLLKKNKITFLDLDTRRSSLEEIFVQLIGSKNEL